MPHRFTLPRLVAGATGLALAAGLFAGCGGDSDEPAASAAATTAQPAQTTAPSPAETTPAETTPAESEPTPAVVTAEGAKSGVRFRFVLTELRRSGPTVTANARVEYLGGDDERLQISDTFDDGQYQELQGRSTSELGDVFDGIALIDPAGRKKYLVARDETGYCVCSNDLSSEFLRQDSPVLLQATLAAPPEDVAQVDVVVPNVKTFNDVPLSD